MIDEFIIDQARVFLYAIVCGGVLSMCYDGWKRLGRAVKVQGAVVDMLYWIIAGVVLFLFTEWSNQGKIRGYLFAGWCVGWWIDRTFFYKKRSRLAGGWTHLLKKMRKTVRMMIGRR